MLRFIAVLTTLCCLLLFSACPKQTTPKVKTSKPFSGDDLGSEDDNDDTMPSSSSGSGKGGVSSGSGKGGVSSASGKGKALREVLLAPSTPNLSVAFAPTLGPPDAPATITVFTDFACLLCAQMVKPLKQVMYAYRGKVRLVFKNYPQHRSHFIYAQAAMAAHKQGRFWAYHDLLFAHHKTLTRASLLRYAQQLRLKMKTFRKDMDSFETRAHVEADELQGQRKGLRQIPSFFLNQKKLVTPSGYRFFQREINKLLIRKGYKKSRLPRRRPPAQFDLRDSPIQGDLQAPLTLVAFLDFENPMCVWAAPQLRRLLVEFQGKVRLVFKYYPERFQGKGWLAAQAAHAAYQEGKFWPFSRLLWANPKKLERTSLKQYAQKLHLNLKRFAQALDRQIWLQRVKADRLEGKRAGVVGVPTLFLNGYKTTGFSFASLKRQVLLALKERGLRVHTSASNAGRGLFQTRNSPTLGPVSAQVTVVIFSDFTSSFGEMLAPSIRKLARTFQGKVRWVFKHFPESGNATAWFAAQASMAAHAQGKFWAYHDLLFANPNKLRRKDLERYAAKLGLDQKRFQQALEKKSYLALLQQDKKEGKQNAVIGAPTVFVNGQQLSSVNEKILERAIRQALKIQRGK